MSVAPFLRSLLVALGLALFVSACGGSSTSTRPPAAPPPPPPPPPAPPPEDNFDTEEFRRSTGLDNIRALAAFEAGGSGEGVIVGTVDTGVDLDHIDLRNNISPLSLDVATGRKTPTANDTDGHGTFVAGIIAAERNDRGTLGVAFNATIFAARADDPGSCEDEKEDGCVFFDDAIARGIIQSVNNGAKVINISLGGEGFGFQVLNAIRTAAQNDVLVVISAGNESELDPSGFAQVALDPIARGNVLIIGATDQLDQLASFSNKAGNLAEFFLVAPGVGIRSTSPDDFVGIGSGTSFSAPHVSGAAALLIQMFPNLTMREVAEILILTATDLGAPGRDAIFGNGLINLEAAIQPLGATAIASAAGASPVDADDSGMAASAAFGDGFRRTGALDGIIITDRFDRTFRKNFSETVLDAPRGLSLEGLISRPQRIADRTLRFGPGARLAFEAYDDRFVAVRSNLSSLDQATASRPRTTAFFATELDAASDLRVAFGHAPARLLSAGGVDDPSEDFMLGARIDTPFLAGGADSSALAVSRRLPGGLRLDLAFSRSEKDGNARDALAPLREDSNRQTMVAQMRYHLGGAEIGLQAGVSDETGALLGARSSGALDFGQGASSSFVALDARLGLGGDWQAFGRYLTGFTRARSDGAALLGDIGRLRSESFALGVTGHDVLRAGDRFGFSVIQPLRVTGGDVSLTVPVFRDLETGIFSFESRSFSLSPSGREVDLEMSYGLRLGFATTLEAGIIQQFEAGHVKNGGAITNFLIRARTRF